jgi:acetyl-CoA carboxylase biotin carboxylase subunit
MEPLAFRRVLVANRGEIAVRIIRACRALGLETVALFSDADAEARHVVMADAALHVGPPPSSESYLCADRILSLALDAGCDAVHPGYGFLSENAAFAQAAIDAGMTWIGPPPSAIASMGSKTQARLVMEHAGVPVVPGNSAALSSLEETIQLADEIGYPVMLKAAMGGGGKGMRQVDAKEDLESALLGAQSEARKSFGDDSVYLEKRILQPKHVEIQVLADKHGNVIHLFERDCSVQRRHQKVIEEAPCAVLSSSIRESMAKAACDAARAVQYEGAGTVEFLLCPDGAFYFLEMNTRLQVEHPITEMITGVDLVQAQCRIASGEPLWLRQEDLSIRGHSIECRIYAEDARRGFRPAPGVIQHYAEPQGPFVRVDSGVQSGSDVSVHYDPMIAKLVVWGANREEAIRRCERALREFEVVGICTSIPLFFAILRDEAFQKGEYDTSFLTEQWMEANIGDGPVPSKSIVALAAVLRQVKMHALIGKGEAQREPAVSAWRRTLSWKHKGRGF